MQALILISASAKNPDLKNTLSYFMETVGMTKHRWLAEGENDQWAIECHFKKETDKITSIRKMGDSLGLDINLINEANRQKKLLLADMDSTLVKGESLDEVATKAGIGDQIANITLQSMRGELDFNQSIIRRIAMLKGLREEILIEIIAETQLNNGASSLAPTMKKNGAFCYIVSGGFDFLAIPIAKKIGFDGSFSNRLEIEDLHLTGNLIPPILDLCAKQETLNYLCEKHDIKSSDVAAIGDGANDLRMLENAGLGVAFQGKPLLREKVETQLNHTDLTGLLFLQGYTNKEICS